MQKKTLIFLSKEEQELIRNLCWEKQNEITLMETRGTADEYTIKMKSDCRSLREKLIQTKTHEHKPN